MSDELQKKQQAKRVLLQALEGKASILLIRRLLDRLEKCTPDEAGMKACIKDITVAVKLFVDEDVGRTLEQELSALCNS
ncbi:MAG TPA: hypothetical protein VM425_01655 [Myxococcota bacterium]|nr:hypothetical protein [Myxococcota bacterium]